MLPYVGMARKQNGGYNASLLDLVFSETALSIQRFHDHDLLLAKMLDTILFYCVMACT